MGVKFIRPHGLGYWFWANPRARLCSWTLLLTSASLHTWPTTWSAPLSPVTCLLTTRSRIEVHMVCVLDEQWGGRLEAPCGWVPSQWEQVIYVTQVPGCAVLMVPTLVSLSPVLPMLQPVQLELHRCLFWPVRDVYYMWHCPLWSGTAPCVACIQDQVARCYMQNGSWRRCHV